MRKLNKINIPVVRVGKNWFKYTDCPIVFEGKTIDECKEYIKDHLKQGTHAYIDIIQRHYLESEV